MRIQIFFPSILTLLILCISLNSASRELQKSGRSNVHRTVDGKILISASCNFVEYRLNEIKAWTAKTRDQCQSPKQVTSSEGECTYDITQCVPEHVKKYHGLTGTEVGPNCWNTALVMSQILPFMRDTPPEEWSFYMNSPLCKEVPDSEPLKAGDIGSMEARAPGQTLQVHGFIHISDSLVYAKDALMPIHLSHYSPMIE